MALVTETDETYILTDDCSTKNNHESSDTPVLPSGDSVNNSGVLKSSGNENAETERCERRKKTRRGKPKRKNPYNKEGNEMRKAANHSKTHPRFAHRHADAPYNTNEFLMEDHNSFVNALVEPVQPSNGTPRQPRVRDPSFTSADSDEDNFYSSPEDEEEYLTKEFSNTYEELHVESLQDMSKPELIQQLLQLEEKVDILEKRLGNKTRNDKDNDKLIYEMENTFEDGDKISTGMERVKQFQLEIGRLRLENEKLKIENDRLQRRNRSSSVSSVDSESDSTTSSPSSVSDLSDKEELLESNVNEDMDDSRGKFSVVSDESIIVDDSMNEKNNGLG